MLVSQLVKMKKEPVMGSFFSLSNLGQEPNDVKTNANLFTSPISESTFLYPCDAFFCNPISQVIDRWKRSCSGTSDNKGLRFKMKEIIYFAIRSPTYCLARSNAIL